MTEKKDGKPGMLVAGDARQDRQVVDHAGKAAVSEIAERLGRLRSEPVTAMIVRIKNESFRQNSVEGRRIAPCMFAHAMGELHNRLGPVQFAPAIGRNGRAVFAFESELVLFQQVRNSRIGIDISLPSKRNGIKFRESLFENFPRTVRPALEDENIITFGMDRLAACHGNERFVIGAAVIGKFT